MKSEKEIMEMGKKLLKQLNEVDKEGNIYAKRIIIQRLIALEWVLGIRNTLLLSKEQLELMKSFW